MVLAVLWVAAEGHCYICSFPLEIVTSPPGLCVGRSPQMRGCCSRRPPGMEKERRGAGLRPGLHRKTGELAAPQSHRRLIVRFRGSGCWGPGLAFPSVKWAGVDCRGRIRAIKLLSSPVKIEHRALFLVRCY